MMYYGNRVTATGYQVKLYFCTVFLHMQEESRKNRRIFCPGRKNTANVESRGQRPGAKVIANLTAGFPFPEFSRYNDGLSPSHTRLDAEVGIC